MRDVHILTIFSTLLFSLAMLFGHEAFATIEIPNMTETQPPSDFTSTPNFYTETIPLEKLAMSALFGPGGPTVPTGWYVMTGFWIKPNPV